MPFASENRDLVAAHRVRSSLEAFQDKRSASVSMAVLVSWAGGKYG